MAVIANAAYRASALIAAEKGAFPLYDAAEYAEAPMVKRLDPEVQALIAEHGLRNALLTSIAPTGTISLYAGNVSSGIEPIFANAYTRKVLQPDGTRTEEEVVDYAVQMWRDLKGDADLPDHFVTPRTSRRWITCACRPPRSPGWTRRSPRRSTCPPISGSRRSRMSISKPTRPGARAARPTGPTT
jgi:hypothetical protein